MKLTGLKFLLEFIKDKKTVGAIAPSSPALAREIVSHGNLSDASVVVEYGPGTGSFTAEILSRLNDGACFLTIEQNRTLAAHLKKRFPNLLLFEDSVENVPRIIESLGHTQVDCIISGLPWASFSPDLQDRLLRPTLSVLRPGGTFCTFTYVQSPLLPSGKRFRKKLRKHFSEVFTSSIVWRNLPPAFVYRCIK